MFLKAFPNYYLHWVQCRTVSVVNFSDFYAPNFEKVGDILVSAGPYCVCMYVFMFEISS